MEILKKIIIVLLLSYTFEASINVESITNVKCDEQGLTTFEIEATSVDSLNEDYIFNFEIDDKYIVYCSIPVSQNSTEPVSYTETLEVINTTETSEVINTTETSEVINTTETSEVINTTGISTITNTQPDNQLRRRLTQILRYRLLQESQNYKGYCKISGNINHAEIINISYINAAENIIFNNNLNFSLNSCLVAEDNYKTSINISFSQLNQFKYDENQKLITFYFYGMITDKMRKGYLITMDVYLIKQAFIDNKATTAGCRLMNDIEKGNQPVQGNFYCTILNVQEPASSFIFHSSKDISGIPSDKTLLDPVKTDQFISKNEIIGYYANSTNEIIPSFIVSSIESNNCEVTGEFTINGNLSSNLSNDIQFELPFAYPINFKATCNIKKSEGNIMKCKTKEKITNQTIRIAQTSLLDNKKKELLLIEKYESTKKYICANSKLKIIENSITFRQVNKFRKLDNNKFSFLFVGLSPKRINKGEKIKILVVLIKNEKKKNQKDIECILNSDVIPFNGGYSQANFNCEGELEDGADSIEIISSNNVTGINDELEAYQKNPKLTDEEINKTKNDGGIGKVIDYSLEANKLDNLPIIEIISISNSKKCADKGKIQFKSKFNEDMNQKMDFVIPLTYPSSSIKCSSPKAKANREISIDCKVQKDFYGINEIFIEPLIIKKKNKEILLVNKTYLNNIGEIDCSNYNQKKLETSKQKYESNYTFVQANSFNIINNRILFNLIIYSLNEAYKDLIYIYVTITKRVTDLRNLQEVDEQEVQCKYEEIQKSQLGYYSCSMPRIDINSQDEIENFIIESDDMSGFYESNTNPIETDENIQRGKVSNFSEPEIIKLVVPFLKDTTYLNESCEKDGVFKLEGILINKEISEKGLEAELNFINPPDSGAICSFNETKKDSKMVIVCQNKEYFEYENLIIGTQMIGGKFLLNKTISSEPTTCAISSYSFYQEPERVSNITNNYFNKNSSSKGLSGGAIAAIVIICTLVLIGIGILIALFKNGAILSSKPKENTTVLPPISNSSANII